jgi:hypothetical protein
VYQEHISNSRVNQVNSITHPSKTSLLNTFLKIRKKKASLIEASLESVTIPRVKD